MTTSFLEGGSAETTVRVATRVTGSRCSSNQMKYRQSSVKFGEDHKAVALLRRH